MHLFLLGVSHRTAPVDLRERLDFSSRDQGAAVQAVAAQRLRLGDRVHAGDQGAALRDGRLNRRQAE